MQERMYSPPKLSTAHGNQKNKHKKAAEDCHFHLFPANCSSTIIQQPMSWRLTLQRECRAAANFAKRVSLTDFCSFFQADDSFFSCSHNFESVLAAIASAKDAAQQVCRILVECIQAPYRRTREMRTLTHCRALAAILAHWSWRPLASASFE